MYLIEVCTLDVWWPPASIHARSAMALGKSIHTIYLEGLCYTHSDTTFMTPSISLTQFSSWCLYPLFSVYTHNWMPIQSQHMSFSYNFVFLNVVTICCVELSFYTLHFSQWLLSPVPQVCILLQWLTQFI